MTWTSPPPPARGRKPYRSDIEGLRAVAVMAVVLFHFDVPPFTGGFVGVDVFFVISGFLITSIVAADLRAGSFSVLAFYERRLRRIVPALLLVVLVSTLAGLVVLLPGDLRPVGWSLMNAALFTSNIVFFSLANDYFAADNLVLMPVLHTWSLSVEAQFYLVYPWLLMGLGRRPGLTRPVLVVLAALSLAGSVWGVFHAPSATFYLLPSRAWELLLGALLALAPSWAWSRAASEAMAGVGLAMIVLASVALTRAMPFPGGAALLPCCGAALVIASGSGGAERGLVTRLLAARPPALLGRMSYSLYLWHWPLLVFASYGRADALRAGERAALIGLAFCLAAATWRLVERPFIMRVLLPRPRRFLAAAAIATASVVTVAGLVEQAGQYGVGPRTLPADVLTLAEGQYDTITGDCRPDDLASASAPPCRFGTPGQPPTVLLWGNSYARMWTPTLDIDAKAHSAAGVSLLLSKCVPLAGVAFPDLPGCEDFNDAALAYLRSHPAVRIVVLGANWFVAGPRLRELDRGLSALKALGLRVFVILAPPQPGFSVPRTLAMAALRRQPPPPPIDQAEARAAQRASTEIIEALRQIHGFTVIDPADRICDGAACRLEIDGRPVFFDAGHLTVTAARTAAGLFEPVFDRFQ